MGRRLTSLDRRGCCMLTDAAEALYAPLFAAWDTVHGSTSGAATLSCYTNWIAKVATIEFADELVLAAAAKRLQVCITTVPHTPAGNDLWAIAEHPLREHWPVEHISEDHEIVMGNNDVHYVWLRKE